jgi:hypothetical protein
MEMDMELVDLEIKIKKEMRYFMAIIIMGLAFGGIAMAFGISSITLNALALRTMSSNIFLNILLIVIGSIVAYLALRYFISTAEVLSRFKTIKESKTEEKNRSREKLTEQIIKLMNLYRDEKHQIKRMIIITKIAGACFLANAIIQTVLLVININAGTAEVVPSFIGILISSIMSAVGFFLPSSFQKYSICWDERLVRSLEAEKKIATIMEEP